MSLSDMVEGRRWEGEREWKNCLYAEEGGGRHLGT